MVRDLTQILTAMPAAEGGRAPTRAPGAAPELLRRTRGEALVQAIVVGYLVVIALGSSWWRSSTPSPRPPERVADIGLLEAGQVISSLVSGALVLVGLIRWRRSRLAAYRWFQRALLVTIFVTEFFAFYQNQNAQFLGLAEPYSRMPRSRHDPEEEVREGAVGAYVPAFRP